MASKTSTAEELAPAVFNDLFASEARPILRHWAGRFYRHDGRRYRQVESIILRKNVRVWLAHQGLPLKEASKICSEFKYQPGVHVPEHWSPPCLLPQDKPQLTEADDPEPAPLLIPLRNGLFDVAAWQNGGDPLMPHTPQLFTPTCHSFAYDPAATAPQFERFLEQSCLGDVDQIQLAKEWSGYLFVPDTSLRGFLVMIGPTASGKTTWLDVLTEALGHDNITNVPLEGLGSQFREGAMVGMLANFCHECRYVSPAAAERIKALSSGDRQTQDLKHRDSVTYTPTARLVLVSNEEPRFSDSSAALWDRLSVLHFSRTVPKDERDLQLGVKLKDELPGIFNLAMAALKRLYDRGQFVHSAVSVRLVKEFQLKSNPPRMFVEECLVAKDSRCETREQIVRSFRHFCLTWNFSGKHSRDKIFAEVRRRFPWVEEGQRTWRKVRERVFFGIRIDMSGCGNEEAAGPEEPPESPKDSTQKEPRIEDDAPNQTELDECEQDGMVPDDGTAEEPDEMLVELQRQLLERQRLEAGGHELANIVDAEYEQQFDAEIREGNRES